MKNKIFLFLALFPLTATSCVDDSATLAVRGVLSAASGECSNLKADNASLQRSGVLDLSVTGEYAGRLLLESSTLATKAWKSEGSGGQSGGSTLDIVNPKYANAITLQSIEFKCISDLCKNFSYPDTHIMTSGSLFAPVFVLPIIDNEAYIKMTPAEIDAKFRELQGKRLDYEISVKYKNNLSSIKGETNRLIFSLQVCNGCLNPSCKPDQVPTPPNQCSSFGSDVRWECKKVGEE